MHQSARVLCVAVVFASAAAAGCGSNNKGKIEGKWKLVSMAGDQNMMKEMEMVKGYMYFDFRPDGTLIVGAESSDPAFQQMIAAAGGKTSLSMKYRLSSGDWVEMYDLPKEMTPGKGGGLFGSGKD